MEGRRTEPRTALWADAEVSWEDHTGAPNRASATLEDTSPSGACIRLKKPIMVGSRLSVKWYMEQFSAIARNCRSDGREFLLGVRRDTGASPIQLSPPAKEIASEQAAVKNSPAKETNQKKPAAPSSLPPPDPPSAADELVATPSSSHRERSTLPRSREDDSAKSTIPRADPARPSPAQPKGASTRRERKAMQSKGFFPNLWRKQDDTEAPAKLAPTEAPVNRSQSHPAEGLGGPQTDLLSYEDIYRSAGIWSPSFGYGIHKVVDMLNSDRIRNLSPDIKRASVLMALDAAGTSADDLLQDAKRRQQALTSYEAGQQKQLEQFEARKGQENTLIQAEMERVTAHYAERIQHNQDQVGREKETLRNWKMQKQYENQRISEVIELCGKQNPAKNASPASSGTPVSTEPAGNSRTPPNPIPEVSMGR